MVDDLGPGEVSDDVVPLPHCIGVEVVEEKHRGFGWRMSSTMDDCVLAKVDG